MNADALFDFGLWACFFCIIGIALTGSFWLFLLIIPASVMMATGFIHEERIESEAARVE